MKKINLFVTILLFSISFLNAQENDPARKEDAAIERQRILKAADQIETMTEQVVKMQQEMQTVKQEMESLRTENYKLKQLMEINEAKRLKERDVILTEVAKSIAKVSKEKEAAEEKAAQVEKEKKKEKDEAKEAQKAKVEKGYEHVVEKGQTLWIIAKAYRDKGINVTVADIKKANNLKPNASLKVGQKIFIPQPSK